jgi:hypothetical protein
LQGTYGGGMRHFQQEKMKKRKKEKQYQQWTSDVFKREKKKGE